MFLFALLIVLAGVLAFLPNNQFKGGARDDVIAEVGDSIGKEIYLQTDSRWAYERLGGSGEEMRRTGCTVCCISMAMEYCGFKIDPGRLNRLLKVHSGYTTRGWVKWYALSRMTRNKIRIELPDRPSLKLIDATLKEGYPVIAKVLVGGGITHWVLIAAKDGDEYLIKDPLGSGKGLEKLSKYDSDILSIRILKSGDSGSRPSLSAEQPKTLDEPAGPVIAVKQMLLAAPATDPFANCVARGKPTIVIRSRIDDGPWKNASAVYPLKGQKVALGVEEIAAAAIRWWRISADTSKIYKNANFPWDKDPYKWVGFGKIDYLRTELEQFRGRWEIEPFANSPSVGAQSRYSRKDVGSFWFQAEIAAGGRIYRSAGIEDSDNRGLSPQVFRVSTREGNGYIGHLSSFFNVPGVFGSVTYQSNNYIGVDCADVLMAALGRFRGRPVERNYNVAMLVSEMRKVSEFELANGSTDKRLEWGDNIKRGDFIAVRYAGSRQYQHVGALYADANKNRLLDASDLVIHAGPQALHISSLAEGEFDGQVAVLRP